MRRSQSEEFFIFWIELFGSFQKILQKNLHGSCSWVEINLHIHLVTAEDIILDSVHSITLKGDTIFNRTNDTKDPCQIKLTIKSTCEVGVTKEIVHAVRINLTRNQLNHLFVWISVIDNAGYFFWKIWCDLQKNLVNLSLGVLDYFLSNCLMVSIKEIFESMRVGTMSKVVEKCCSHGQERFIGIPFFRVFFFENLRDLTGNFVDA